MDEFNSRYVVGEEDPPIRARRTARPHVRKRIAPILLLAALVGIAVVTALVIAAWKSSVNRRFSTSSASELGRLRSSTGKRRAQPRPAKESPSGPYPALLLVRKGGATGKVLFNEGLSSGQTKHFTTKKLWINTGTPENLRITVNGKRVALPTGAPQVFVVTSRGISSA